MNIVVSVAAFSLVLLSTTAAGAAEGDAALGQKAFQRCSACHSTTDQTKAGPGLGGVVGRTAGTMEGVRYSAAMKASGLVWDEAMLDRFLAAPRDVVPKTTMTASVPYLKSLTQ
jgi:cytochrome c